MSATIPSPARIESSLSTDSTTGAARSASSAASPPLATAARRAIWALPVWALLLALSTLTHQPGYDTDFRGYAEYITTGQFLASHLIASIFGAGLGVVGAVALVVLLADTGAARRAFWGLSAFTVGQVLNTSVFGVAAFFQPAIGDAFLAGHESVAVSVNESVYGEAIFATVGIGLLLWIFGLVQIGRAVRQSARAPRWAGHAILIAAPAFAIAGFAFPLLQPVAGLVLAISALAVATRLSETH